MLSTVLILLNWGEDDAWTELLAIQALITPFDLVPDIQHRDAAQGDTR